MTSRAVAASDCARSYGSEQREQLDSASLAYKEKISGIVLFGLGLRRAARADCQVHQAQAGIEGF